MAEQKPRISMFILMQYNLEQAIDFYTKLGFKLGFQLKDQWAEFDADGIKIGLAQTPTELPERRTGIILEVDDLNNFCDEMDAKGIACSERIERLHGIMSSIKDPGNNILEVYQATPEKVQEALKNKQ
jgi:catechol 2,3-dioxygenase-like lactoylglutathione lyase family enzyme